jgi:hypothetical protein
MEVFEKILELSSEYEAELMGEILKDRNIPFGLVSAGDSAIGGIWELENGWGYVEAPPRYRDEISKIYEEISKE